MNHVKITAFAKAVREACRSARCDKVSSKLSINLPLACQEKLTNAEGHDRMEYLQIHCMRTDLVLIQIVRVLASTTQQK